MEKEIVTEEIEEKINEEDEVEETQPLLNPNPNPNTVKTKVPEVEINVYRKGRGPIDKFKTNLGGWDQDRLEVVDFIYKYGFKSIFAKKYDHQTLKIYKLSKWANNFRKARFESVIIALFVIAQRKMFREI
ncbi:hypothetical protein MKX01_010651 [Papaver californicum]|nr:hypothetical protein MKX01_010651 [Papaver californicum]